MSSQAHCKPGEKGGILMGDCVSEELEALFLPSVLMLSVSVTSPVISGCHQAQRLLLDWLLFLSQEHQGSLAQDS